MEADGELRVTVYRFLGESIGSAIDAYVAPATERLIDALALSVGTFVGLYLWLFLVAVLYGLTPRPLAEVGRVAFRYIVVGAIALSAAEYDAIVVGFFSGLESDLVGIMTGHDGAEAASIYTALDETFAAGLELLVACFDRANALGWRDLGMILAWQGAGVVIGVAAAGLTLVGAVTIIVAKLLLAVLFSIGPLFLLCLVFAPLGRYFDAWVSAVLNFVLVVVFTAVTMAFALAMFSRYVAGASLAGDQHPGVVALLIVVVATALALVVHAVKGVAATLAGGLALGAITLRQAAQSALSPVSNTSGALGAARNAVDPRSTRRDLESGMLVSAPRSHHLLAGNTMANPAYRQYVASRAGRHWASASGGKATRTP